MGQSESHNTPSSHFQPIYDVSEICAQKGISNAILCPGSRCAPLILAFARNSKIKTLTISDERSAAFIACGISLHDNIPTVLVCTSGSATYHFAPAIAESFFQQIPLVVITADRPKEWIDQWDGQTIRQTNLYKEHVKKGYELPQEYGHPDAVWHINRIVNEAINLSNQHPKGPVHINVPLREPLYPDIDINFSQSIRIIEEKIPVKQLSKQNIEVLHNELSSYKKVLIIVGQHSPDNALTQALEHFSKIYQIPVIVDIASNQHGLSRRIIHADSILDQRTPKVENSLRPELLITVGKSILSKNTKHFIRKYKPAQHWHVQENAVVADPYQGLTLLIPVDDHTFFEQLINITPHKSVQKDRTTYCRLWEAEEQRIQCAIKSFFTFPQHNEFHLVNSIVEALHTPCNLHFSNSLPIRYASLIGITKEKCDVHIVSNRGISGIDGCTSVAVGHAMASKILTVLVTGDMAFFYDRNAFWHNYALPNLRVVVLNNHGGAIFSTLEGSSQLPELESYFATHQRLTAKSVANELGFDYIKVDTMQNIKNILNIFFTLDGKTKILEIETEKEIVKKTMDTFKLHLKKNHAS